MQSAGSSAHTSYQVDQKWAGNQRLNNHRMFSLEISLLICALFFKRISFKTNIRIFIWIFLWNYYFELISIMCMPAPAYTLELCYAIKVNKKAGGESQTAIALFQTWSFTFQTEFYSRPENLFFPNNKNLQSDGTHLSLLLRLTKPTNDKLSFLQQENLSYLKKRSEIIGDNMFGYCLV